MHIYIATLVRRDRDNEPGEDILLQHHADTTPAGLAVKVDESLDQEEREWGHEIPRNFSDILIECQNASGRFGPLSIGEDTDLSCEYLLFTSIEEV